jgi:hypothetical protein
MFFRVKYYLSDIELPEVVQPSKFEDITVDSFVSMDREEMIVQLRPT